MEKEKTSPEQTGSETAVKDFIRFLPEEKRDSYELMLRRCNFHDDNDPLFPIMLFLLFFQESVSENVDRIEDSIAELKGMPLKCGKKDKYRPSILRIAGLVLIALIIVILSLFWGGILRKNRRPAMAATQNAQHELQKMNRYWLDKLEAEERSDAVSQRSNWFIITAVNLGCSAGLLLFFLIIFMRKIRKTEKLLLASRRINSPDQEKENQMKRKKHKKFKVQHSQQPHSATNNTPDKKQLPASVPQKPESADVEVTEKPPVTAVQEAAPTASPSTAPVKKEAEAKSSLGDPAAQKSAPKKADSASENQSSPSQEPAPEKKETPTKNQETSTVPMAQKPAPAKAESHEDNQSAQEKTEMATENQVTPATPATQETAPAKTEPPAENQPVPEKAETVTENQSNPEKSETAKEKQTDPATPAAQETAPAKTEMATEEQTAPATPAAPESVPAKTELRAENQTIPEKSEMTIENQTASVAQGAQETTPAKTEPPAENQPIQTPPTAPAAPDVPVEEAKNPPIPDDPAPKRTSEENSEVQTAPVAPESKEVPVEKQQIYIETKTGNGSLFLQIIEVVLKIIQLRLTRKLTSKPIQRTNLELAQPDTDLYISVKPNKYNKKN